MGFVSIDMWTIIFQWCNLLILFFLVRKFLFRPVQAILDKREHEIHDMYEEAGSANKEAEDLKRQYVKKMQDSRKEADDIIKNAVQKAALRSDDMLQDAKERAQNMLRQAEKEIYAEKRNAMNDVKNDISDMAVNIAGKIIEKDMKKEDHEELIRKLIEELGEAS